MTEICCDICVTRGPKNHFPLDCPKITSINKIREQKGYVPIRKEANGWVRRDDKMVKSVETRVDALEKEVAGLKAKVGAIEAQVQKGQGKRKAEDPPAGATPPKKQKGNKKKKDEAPTPAAATADGGKDKKKRKRGKKSGKTAQPVGNAA